jgi:REP element-mobilizing transposase RayT
MSQQPKILIENKVHFVTARVEKGLPFVCTEYMKLILMSAIARAQHLYKIKVCAFLWMGNHFHMVVVVTCPASFSLFMDRIKTETAHAVNRLQGHRNITVWTAKYHSPPVLTVEDVIEKLIYLYTNPAQANLESSIALYPGCSSWDMFYHRETSVTVPWIQRPMLEELSSPALSEQQDRAFMQHLRESAKAEHQFVLSPDDWMECFDIPQGETEKYRFKVIEGVKKREEELAKTRDHKVLGAKALRFQKINVPFTPKKFSRKMWCICWDVEIRKEFIANIKKLIAEGQEVYQLWKKGDFSRKYPKELFPPRVPMAFVTPSAA